MLLPCNAVTSVLQKEEVTAVKVLNPAKVCERSCIFNSQETWEKLLYSFKSCVGLQKGGRAGEAVAPFTVAVLNIILQRRNRVNKDQRQ